MKFLSYALLITFSLWVASFIYLTFLENNIFFLNNAWEITRDTPNKAKAKNDVSLVLPGVVREVTAYNVGDVNQNDDEPCVGASGDNLCELINNGAKICAANFVELGSFLYIDGHGECQVLDRTNSKYSERVDVAMAYDQYDEAINFGRQKLAVRIQ